MFLVRSKRDKEAVFAVYAVKEQRDEVAMTPPRLVFLTYWGNEWEWILADHYEPVGMGK